MKIKTQNYNDVMVVQLQGKLDSESIKLFQDTITDIITARKASIVLDMSNTKFVDSAGLEQLLYIRDYCSENNCQLRLAGLNETLTEILEVTRLKNEFDRYTELAEAVRSFA